MSALPRREPEDEKDRTSADCIFDAVFAMRWFGESPVAIGIGPYGADFVERSRCASSDETDSLVEGGSGFLMASRIFGAGAGFRFGAQRLVLEGRRSCILVDFVNLGGDALKTSR